MKPRIIITILIGLTMALEEGQGQSWIGTAFQLDTSIILSPSAQGLDLSHLKYRVCDSVFYFTDMRAFQRKETDYDAVIHALSLDDYVQYDIRLPFPPTTERRERASGTYWIYDFDLSGDLLVLATQEQLLVYRRTGATQYLFDTLFPHRNCKAAYLHNGSVFYLEEDHDFGYRWFQRPIQGGRERLVRELAYEAPHVVQANPNRYLFHDENALYFLSTRSPVLHKYSLDGQWLEEIRFDLPHWHPFEEEYIRKSLSVPYGVERIFATKDDIFRYSYPKLDFPLGNNHLLYYTQYDTLTGRSVPAFAIRDSHGSTRLYSAKDTSTSPYGDGRFPFNLLHPQEDKAHLSWGDLLLEISADDTINWRGLTPEAYKQSREAYFKRNDPVFKIRIMRYKNTDPTAMPFLVDTDSKPYSLEDLPQGKSILLVNNELECSACVRHLLQLLNDSTAQDVHIGILYSFIPGALQEREIHNSIKKHLERPFRLYYLDRRRHDRYPAEWFGGITAYPALLFHETGRAPILFSLDDILDDDPYSIGLKDGFMEQWRQFNHR